MAKLVAIIFLFLSTSLDAQTVIMGKVIANSGDPVSGVHIYCIENEKGATTDSLGFFQLECIIPSTLEFTHINYKKRDLQTHQKRCTFRHHSPEQAKQPERSRRRDRPPR